MEADFFSVFHVDINECSLRRMRNLYFRLPVQCQVNWEIGNVPEEARLWDVNTYMLANLIDAIQALDWHFVAANSKRTPRPPKPFKRPEIKKKQPIRKAWAGKTIVDKGKRGE